MTAGVVYMELQAASANNPAASVTVRATKKSTAVEAFLITKHAGINAAFFDTIILNTLFKNTPPQGSGCARTCLTSPSS